MPALDIKAIFQQALDLEPAGRAAFLDRACADHPEAKARVEVLLKALDDAGSFLEEAVTPAGTDGGASPADDSLSDPTAAYDPTPDADFTVSVGPSPTAVPTGTRIGPYKLLQVIGEGGMGLVYMAEQEHPVRRKVALKVIKPGMDTAQVIARFEAERQALAMMNHPNIAGVLDAGTTTSGLPYFVMELVRGIPITRYCDEARLSAEDRLSLFIPVCAAIQHAHQKGIIHRDVKPSNILVTIIDGKPVPKVIDFGIAKATDQRLTERTMFTQLGALVGTPEKAAEWRARIERNAVEPPPGAFTKPTPMAGRAIGAISARTRYDHS